MKQIRFNISLYIIVPVIIAGLSILSAIVSYWVAESNIRHGVDLLGPFFVWVGMIVFIAFVIGLIVLWLLLRPVQKFVEKALSTPAVSSQNIANVQDTEIDELKRIARVFDTVTDVLSRVEARKFFPEITGESRAMRGVLSQILKVAPTDSTVLILGESGTGKELVAKSIYEHSARKGKPFMTLNCAAIPSDLLESELFGHEKGAFTGASSRKIGKFELADKGMIFLDEIGDMPLNLQGKILRVLQEREFSRVGGSKAIKVDIRIISATNKDIETMVSEGSFREDLFYRLNVFALYLPPLKERLEDIPLLVDIFLKGQSSVVQISSEALNALMCYSWPGNIRELQNTIERAAVICKDNKLEVADLAPSITKQNDDIIPETDSFGVLSDGSSLDDQLNEFEKRMVIDALKKTDGVQVEAAKILGINARSLLHRIKKHNIDIREFKVKKT